MNRQSLIFEIGVEEIPSQYVATMAESLRENAEKMIAELRLSCDSVKVYYTPRRFALTVKNLSDEQEELKLTVKGPARKIAFDQDGNPTKALQGFLTKNQKEVADIYTISDAKAEYVAVDVVKEGEKTVDVLKDALSKLVFQIYNPNPMH